MQPPLSVERYVTVLGATGSIGKSTLDVISRMPGGVRLYALTAHKDAEGLYQLCRKHTPLHAVLVDSDAAVVFNELVNSDPELSGRIQVHAGSEALDMVASAEDVDAVMAAIVGAAGLPPVLSAAKAGKQILLANKEALVMSGSLLLSLCEENGAQLLPVDSEHNAIYQCLPHGEVTQGVKKLVLTASGGAFRDRPLSTFDSITVEEACQHPNWEMGRKITVDSATMMNKGLELIEASYLFGIPESDIDVVIHPQSIVHSLAGYEDGSYLAQMGQPDMRIPIAHVLGFPGRIASGVELIDLCAMSALTFERPDPKRYPALDLARQACRMGGYATIFFNAANEVAVDAFLNEKLPFTKIVNLVEEVVAKARKGNPLTLTEVMEVDAAARQQARIALDQRTPRWTI